jgi:hypothetical protein
MKTKETVKPTRHDVLNRHFTPFQPDQLMSVCDVERTLTVLEAA